MAYIMCPTCGTISHLGVGDIAKWYEQYHPALRVGALAPSTCYWCWHELNVGDTVIVRRRLRDDTAAKDGDSGMIRAVHKSTDGAIFLVALKSGEEVFFVRAELRLDQETEERLDVS